MTIYKPGEVILVPFPFTDLTTAKQRPALILSSAAFNKRQRDVIVAAITSHFEDSAKNFEYRLDESEQRDAGLPKPSAVKLGKIVTIDQRLIRKIIGRISKPAMQQILTRLHMILRET